MNSASQVEELSIYHQINLPLDVFCLVHLHTLRVNATPFVSRFELDDDTISTGLSPLISRLNKLRVLSLTNTTASHIPHHALAVLTNITILEIDNCGLLEIPPTISLLTNLQQLRLPNNHLHSMPQHTGNFSTSLINRNVFLFRNDRRNSSTKKGKGSSRDPLYCLTNSYVIAYYQNNTMQSISIVDN